MQNKLFSKHQFLAASLALAITAFPTLAFALSSQVKTIQYNPATQSFSIKSTGPVKATVNAVNIGKTKRVIIDVENAEISMDMPRDAQLLQELSAKLPSVKNIAVNQFGGAKPIVRILMDVEGTNFTATLPKAMGDLVELKLISNEMVATTPAQPIVRPVAANQTATASGTGSYTELKKTLTSLNQKYDQLQSENQQLRSQLQQSTLQSQGQQISSSELQRLRETNQTLQNQLSDLSQQKEDLGQQVQTLSKTRAELNQIQARLKTLQTENGQLKTRVAEVQEAANQPASANLSAPVAAQIAQLQKQVADLNRENTQLRTALKSPSGQAIAEAPSADLKVQIDKAKEALGKSIATINEQNSEIAYLKKQVDKLQIGIDASSKEQLTALNAKLDEKDGQIRQLQDQVNQLSMQPQNRPDATLNTQLVEKDRRLQAMQIQLNQTRQELEKFANKPSASPDEAQALRTELASLKNQYKATVAEYNRQLEDAKKAQPKLESQKLETVELKPVDTSRFEQEIAELNSRLKTAEQKYATALTEIKNLEKAQSLPVSKEDSAFKSQEQIKSLQAKLKDQDFELDKLEGRLSDQDQLVARLKADLKAAQTAMAQAKSLAKSEAIATDAATSKPVADTDLAKDNKRLQGVVDLLKKDNQMLSEDKAATIAKLKKAEDERRKLVEETTSLKRQTSRSGDSQSVASVKLEQLRKELEQARKDSEALRAEKQELSGKLAQQNPASASTADSGLKQDNQNLIKEIKAIKLENDKLNQALKAANRAKKDTSKNSMTLAEANADKAAPKNMTMLAEKETEIEDLRAQLKSLNAQYKDSVATIDRLQDQMKKADKKSGGQLQPLNAGGGDALAQAEKHYKLGQDFDNNNQKSSAYDEYMRATKLDPANAKYMYAASIALAGQQKYDEAVDLLQTFIDSHPYQTEAYNQLGKVYLLSNRTDEAKVAFSKAIPVNVLNNYASALKKLGKMTEAERIFKIAVDINPNDSDILFNLGNIYNSTNNLAEAKSIYSQALDIRPNFAEAHYNLGLVYSKMGDKPNAVSHLEKFLELSPNATNASTIRTYIQKLKS